MKYFLLLTILCSFAVFNTSNAEEGLIATLEIKQSYDYLLLEDKVEEKMSLYPNPCQNQFSLKGNVEFTRLEIINAAGSIVKKYDKDDANSYSIRELQNGIYFVVLFKQNSKKKILKLIKR